MCSWKTLGMKRLITNTLDGEIIFFFSRDEWAWFPKDESSGQMDQMWSHCLAFQRYWGKRESIVICLPRNINELYDKLNDYYVTPFCFYVWTLISKLIAFVANCRIILIITKKGNIYDLCQLNRRKIGW